LIRPQDFVERMRSFGYRYYAGVPCSSLTSLINYTINDRHLHYVSSANEGDALATCAGMVLGGQRAIVMMQNSGLGNAINPLTSLTHVFRIPVLLIVTLRGDPNVGDEPQHELMGRITGTLLETMEIPWEYFPTEARQTEGALQRAEAYMSREMRPYALVMRNGSIANQELPANPSTKAFPMAEISSTRRLAGISRRHLSRADALRRIIEQTPETNTAVIATTGYTGRELFALADRPNHLYLVGSMGCASSLGLGLAMARPDLRVVVIDGDGAALMRMGNFATLGAYGGANLIHILLDNEAHDSTGAQATVSGRMSFAGVAKACGYPIVREGDDLSVIDDLLSSQAQMGPRFGCLQIRTGAIEKLPRPTLSPVQVRARFMAHTGARLRVAC
jgi:phosphonopyruvate decarboxylase